MDTNNCISNMIGSKLPQSILGAEWTLTEKEKCEICDHLGYQLIRESVEDTVEYSYEFPSGYQDQVTLNIFINVDVQNVILDIDIFAYQYACNMMSERLNLKAREEMQIKWAFKHMMGERTSKWGEDYVGLNLPWVLGTFVQEHKRVDEKLSKWLDTSLMMVDCLRKDSEIEMYFSINSDFRKNMGLIVIFITDNNFQINKVEVQSCMQERGSLFMGLSAKEEKQLRITVDEIFKMDLGKYEALA
ncbi:MAG: hypothetical protein E4H16_01175 [Candidatus Atribacteria bacterium]|nr:MAG: hypothetical protein E4H16_01175 [Candidatus Atribacteria bacterium]